MTTCRPGLYDGGPWRSARKGTDHLAVRVTKQTETRDRVLELIERLSIGEAIPSERQLSVDFGVSRLTVRAALDELVREGTSSAAGAAGPSSASRRSPRS